ncbi:MAG: GNAT family N-acetyltransferase [Victivallaceae bacterium]|nr:GNAT family N-acetyltransferase [Victivallaceae bacterium]
MNYRIIKSAATTECAMLAQLYRTAGWIGENEPAAFIGGAVSGSTVFAVAEDDGVIVGMARAISDGVSDAYIQDVAVLPSYRHRGIGGHLVRLVADQLQKAGIDWIALVGEPGTGNFYRELGFQAQNGFTLWKFAVKDCADNSQKS